MNISSIDILIISVLIALVGGIPGIIGIIDKIKNKNRIIWINQYIIYGEVDSNTDFIMISGSITNKGKKSIFPGYYELYYQYKKKWIKLQKVLIGDGINFPSQNQKIEVNNPSENDLQKVNNELTKERPIYGHLMFFMSQEIFENFKNAKIHLMKLICYDSINNHHICKFKIGPLNTNGNNNDKNIFPKIGIQTKNI